jgi:hypothetical protein
LAFNVGCCACCCCVVQELTAWSNCHKLPTSVDQEAARRATLQEESTWGSLGLSCLADTPQASSAAEWLAVASAPNMLQASSLEELASVLGPSGVWQLVLAAAMLCVLRMHNHHMHQTIIALQLAEVSYNHTPVTSTMPCR